MSDTSEILIIVGKIMIAKNNRASQNYSGQARQDNFFIAGTINIKPQNPKYSTEGMPAN